MSVLVGVDPARRSASALSLGALLANSLGTDLVVAAVVATAWPPSRARIDHEWRAHTRETAEIVLDHAASVLGGQVEATYLVHDAASARRGLLELVEEHDPTVVVLGSAHRGEHGRISLGSVSEALLHASPAPVAIAPVGFRVPLDARVGRVTAAYGGSEAATGLIVGAATMTAGTGASLRLASFAVRPEAEFNILAGAGSHSEDPVLGEWAATMHDHADRTLDAISTLPQRPPLEGAVIGIGESWAAAIHDVDWRDDEVLVVGSSSLSPLARVFLGTHATKVVRNAPVPVIVLPRAAVERAEQAERAEQTDGAE